MTQEILIDKIAAAIRSNTKVITIGEDTFLLPSPQGAGTETQKIAYSRLKAKELVSNKFKS